MINILSRETIDKIAAGEVAERPESVVKELLDNAIDSGADSISIEMRKGGTELIRVTDNGCGIDKDDIRTAFLRHATSKLKSAEDLMHISTMGFRGEALASIAAVSRVEMVSKVKNSLTGTLYRIEGGTEKAISEVGAPDGTTILVKDFLYSVPVRRQFLKSPQTETSYVTATVENIALAHPEISISFTADGRSILHTPGNGRLKDVIYIIYGGNVASNLIEVDHVSNGIRVSGYAAKPVVNRSRRDEEKFFVNGRAIRSDVLLRAVEDAFAPYMMQHRFPVVFLNIGLDYGNVDVNVHPRKTEVRFSDNAAVYNAVTEAVKNAVSRRELIVDAGAAVKKDTPAMHAYALGDASVYAADKKSSGALKAEPYEVTKKYEYASSIQELISDKASGFKEDGAVYGADDQSENNGSAYDIGLIPDKGSDKSDLRDQPDSFINRTGAGIPYFKIIGQVFNTYWIIEYNDEMFMIDQHAAHEKVNYERYVSLIKNHGVSSQLLYTPIVLTISSKDAMLLEKNIDSFTEMGYEIEYAGDRDYIVRAVPSNLPEIGEEKLIRDLIEGVFEDGGALSSNMLKDRIASMSCKAAIKGGQYISRAEAESLIKELMGLDNPYACPHGRPTIIKWSKTQIEKLFKRIV